MLPESDYHTPQDVESACQILSEKDGTVLAGGQSLGLLTKEGMVTPEVIVDINEIGELEGIERVDGELRLGATTTHRTIEKSSLVEETAPVLRDAAESIADVQIRNAGTIGGVAAFSDPTAEYPLVFLALDGTVHTKSTDGDHAYDASDFFTGYYQNQLDEGELVTQVRLQTVDEGEGAGYQKFAYRENDRAVVNVVSFVSLEDGTCKEADVAVGSITDRPVKAEDAADELVGTELTDESIESAAATASEEVPIDPDPSISQEYRASLVETLAKKTLEAARDEANGGR